MDFIDADSQSITQSRTFCRNVIRTSALARQRACQPGCQPTESRLDAWCRPDTIATKQRVLYVMSVSLEFPGARERDAFLVCVILLSHLCYVSPYALLFVKVIFIVELASKYAYDSEISNTPYAVLMSALTEEESQSLSVQGEARVRFCIPITDFGGLPSTDRRL